MTERSTLPFSWYSDPAILAREQDAVFRRRWQYVGHTGQVPEPGSLAVGQAGDIPVLLARGKDGVLHAHLNVCRHRGSILVSEDTKRMSIQCPYHAWSYELDGRLRAAPRSQSESNFQTEGKGLVALSVDCWGPFIFVNPDPAAAPLSETLGELPNLVAAAGVDIEALQFRERTVSRYEANWKICCENFLECYHCQVAHPELAEVLDVSEANYRLEEDRWFSSQFGAVKENWSGEFDPTGAVQRGQFHFVYPNLTINIEPGHPNISIGPVIPDGAGRTTRFLDYFFASDTDEAWIDDLMKWDTLVGDQDTALVESVQRGVGAGLIESGELFHSERLIAHFDDLLRADLEGTRNESGF